MSSVSAMSIGALSPETHRTIASAMNSIGGRNNTGEGGEDPDWYFEQLNGYPVSSKIKQVRDGVMQGALIRRACGEITDEQYREIDEIVRTAETSDFRPLVYVIPYTEASSLLQKVPVGRRAHPLSQEFLIEKLPRHCFDVMEF